MQNIWTALDQRRKGTWCAIKELKADTIKQNYSFTRVTKIQITAADVALKNGAAGRNAECHNHFENQFENFLQRSIFFFNIYFNDRTVSVEF